MKVPFFDLGKLISSESAQLHYSLDEVIKSGYFVGGPIVEKFENDFAQYIGEKNVVGVANGLDAIRLLLEAYQIGPGDEVIVPAFTYYATWLGIMQAGAMPVPVDVLLNTGTIDPLLVEAAITPNTKAVLVVHLYGQGADVAPIAEICNKHNLLLFEDAAQSHGARTELGMTGSIGDGAAFSFYPTKNLGALGDAGAISVPTVDKVHILKSRRSYGQGNSKYEHIDTGWNSRLDPIQAAFLSLHLSNLEEWTSRRREIASIYLSALGNRTSSVIGLHSPYESVWHHFILRAKSREDLIKHFASKGVSTDIHYPYSILDVEPVRNVLHLRENLAFPNSELLSSQVLSLPIGPWMNDTQIAHVESAISTIPLGILATD